MSRKKRRRKALPSEINAVDMFIGNAKIGLAVIENGEVDRGAMLIRHYLSHAESILGEYPSIRRFRRANA